MKKGFLSRFDYNSPIILTYFLICLLILGISILTKDFLISYFCMVYKTSWLDIMQYVRMFTHIFGHANIMHLISNFMIILLIGPLMEEKYGSKRIITMILITAFITGFIAVVFMKNTALLGSSGIAFMLILLGSFVNIKQGKVPVTFIFILILYLGNEIYNGLFSSDNISQLAHIIGGLCGSFFGFFTVKKKI